MDAVAVLSSLPSPTSFRSPHTPHTQFFYQCFTGGVPGYTPCGGGLRYNDAVDYCDFPQNVPCAIEEGDGGPVAPTSPSPNPSVSPSPPDPWDEWSGQPNVPGGLVPICRTVLLLGFCFGLDCLPVSLTHT